MSILLMVDRRRKIGLDLEGLSRTTVSEVMTEVNTSSPRGERGASPPILPSKLYCDSPC